MELSGSLACELKPNLWSGLFALKQSLKIRLQRKDICEIYALNNLKAWLCISDQETHFKPYNDPVRQAKIWEMQKWTIGCEVTGLRSFSCSGRQWPETSSPSTCFFCHIMMFWREKISVMPRISNSIFLPLKKKVYIRRLWRKEENLTLFYLFGTPLHKPLDIGKISSSLIPEPAPHMSPSPMSFTLCVCPKYSNTVNSRLDVCF